ncbi:LOW QUALITY PROTEIN: uncharacterized protein LOC117063639 [Trachypithecus francoisi]|uniref:LOW QUALITY PROTEIN: uncharacterized protein LOC117063639 n=1 Tax=Trachypithecus francoisi TaxID=54180 RepID=UPI00141A828C|nr:LOW QUALITY PROTEIN: uncharacterized protein LOC117063639 [Trachypithecus francoisi]
MAISGGLDASADSSLHASTSTPTLQGCVTDRNSYSDDTPEVNTTLAASWPLMGQVHVESGNFTAEPTKVLMALRRVSGSSGRKSFQAACEHSQKQLRILLLPKGELDRFLPLMVTGSAVLMHRREEAGAVTADTQSPEQLSSKMVAPEPPGQAPHVFLSWACMAGIRPQAGGHMPGWQDLSTVTLNTPSGPVLPAQIPLPQDALRTLRIPSRCSGARAEDLGLAPRSSKENAEKLTRFCQIASEVALFAVAAECRAGHSSGQSGARLPCISWAMCADLCSLHCSCVPCTYDCVFPVYSVLLHVFQFRFVVCD